MMVEECNVEEWKIGKESPFYEICAIDNGMEVDNYCILKSITKISDTDFKCQVAINGMEGREFEFDASIGMTIKLGIFCPVVDWMGFDIEDCLCQIIDISKDKLQLRILEDNK